MWDFFNSKTVRAAKRHKCGNCRKTIEKGEKHEYCSGKVEGDFTDYRLCLRCQTLVTAWHLSALNDGEGFAMGELEADLREELGTDTDLDAWAAKVIADYEAKSAISEAKRVRDGRTYAVLQEIAKERARQFEVEGWTPEHDDEHSLGQLALGAATYAAYSVVSIDGCGAVGTKALALWPWNWGLWEPKDPRRDLIRAGALIVAELERLDRASGATAEAL